MGGSSRPLRVTAIAHGAFAALCALLAATAAASPPQLLPSQYMRRFWNTDQGLPESSVQAIAQTPDGYIWFGTQDGLARFDGVAFTVFDGSSTPSLKDSNIHALCPDGGGGLWVGTETGGLFHYSGGRFAPLGKDAGLRSENIRALYLAKDGTLWASTVQGQLAEIRGGIVATLFGEKSGLPHGNLNAICSFDGGIAIGAYSSGLYFLQDGKICPLGPGHLLAGAHILALLSDRSGALWIGTEGDGLMRLQGGKCERFGSKEGMPEKSVFSLVEDAGGAIWIGTLGGGLYRYSAGRFSLFGKSEGLSSGSVTALFADMEGSLWVGTNGGGVQQLRAGLFTPFGAPEGLSDDIISSVLETKDGTMWAGTYGGGLNRYKDGSWSSITRKQGLLDNAVYSLAEAPDGSLWAGTGQGVTRLKSGATAFITEKNGLKNNVVYDIAFSDDTAWLATTDLASYQNGRARIFGRASGLATSTCVCLHKGADGTMWVGTYRGLHKIVGERAVQIPVPGEKVQPEVFAIHEEADGTLWLATYGQGLLRYKNGSWGKVDSSRGLFNDYVYQILEDASGNFWMTCNKGIFSASREALERAANGGPPVKCRLFGKEDGMRSQECNGGTQPAGCVASDGRLWFPTTKGLAVLDPSSLKPEPAPPVVFEQFYYDRKPVAAAPLIQLPPGRGDLEIHFTAPSFTAPSRQSFKYRLEGYDSDWVEARDRRTAYYTNIPPGSYRFEVMSASKDNVWSLKPAALSIQIAPHFYQTAAFYILCAAILAISAFGAYLARVQQLKARQRELEALVNTRTADLQRALATVQAQERELEAFNKELESKVRDQLETILRSKRLTKYFPKRLVDSILGASQDAELRSERRLITIFFTDMAGFTALTEVAEPEKLTEIVNGHLSEMAAAIEKHGGTLARFMGDGILGFFGTPDEMPGQLQAESAVKMAIEMQSAMIAMRSKWSAGGVRQELALRIGIHQDFVTVGNFGSPDHMEYTALGRGINLAKRLETACRPGEVLVSAAVHEQTASLFSYHEAEEMKFKGFNGLMSVYRLDPAEQGKRV